MSDAPALHPYISLMPRAYELSSAMRLGVYDCLYIALAEREGCEFVTADARLVAKVAARFPFVVPLASLP